MNGAVSGDGAKLTIAGLRAEFRANQRSARSVLDEVFDRLEDPSQDPAVWIHRVPREALLERVRELDEMRAAGADLPLFGTPFAVKDNIDVAGIPTTAACPAFAHVPDEHAPAVARLLDAGAVLIGKTNLDQFATGLVGTRSPFGAPRSVFNRAFISGGSSSGSAVAVASGQVAFALGTDTAGSGRVPASFNGIVGLKPTRGRISARGVVPACRSLDCVSILARQSADAYEVLATVAGYDPDDPYSRDSGPLARVLSSENAGSFTFGVPAAGQLEFFGDDENAATFAAAVDRLERLGGLRHQIDLAPFLEAADLLYSGPWVAERDEAFGDFLRANVGRVDPTVLAVVGGAMRISGRDTFRGLHRLQELGRKADAAMAAVDFLVLPTTPTTYLVEEVRRDPIALNARLGVYTNFMNLLDLSGLALPAGFRQNRTAAGITLVGRAFDEAALCVVGDRYEEIYDREVAVPPRDRSPIGARFQVAVVGAHLSGQPLNHQLTSRGGRLVRSTRTAPSYRLYALAGSVPPKPGLVHAADTPAATSIEVEVWELDAAAFGAFVAEVPPPLAIGTLALEDGSTVNGFVCEPRALEGAVEITHFGGWRAYRASTSGNG